MSGVSSPAYKHAKPSQIPEYLKFGIALELCIHQVSIIKASIGDQNDAKEYVKGNHNFKVQLHQDASGVHLHCKFCIH